MDARQLVAQLTDTERWELRQALAAPGKYYGDVGTSHVTTDVDVEQYEKAVVGVWFHCCLLPFTAHQVSKVRALEMSTAYENSPAPINGIEFSAAERS